jgi:hypothetical protein
MKYRIEGHGINDEVEAHTPSKAAKMFAEKGYKGYTIIVDAYGQETHWVLSTIPLSYVYPAPPALSESDKGDL